MTTKEIIQQAKEYWLFFKILLHHKMDGLRLTFAIYMADALQQAKNKQFYVLENGHGRLIWLCNDDIKVMKRPRIVQRLVYDADKNKHVLRKFKVRLIPKETTHADVIRDCYYYTPPSRQNSNGITVEERNQKRKAWLDYMEKYRMDRMYGRRKVQLRTRPKNNG